ncbi:MAG: M16 family metallopeptidase [Vulcanimicrobiaceae bacterium]
MNRPSLLRRIAAALVLVSAMGPLRAPAATGAPPVTTDVSRATLDNGLRVIIVRDPLAPVATEVVNYLVGGQDTPPGFPGMAHAEEHMTAGRSTKDLSEDQIATMTALLGGDDDADTQESITQYYTSTPAAYLDIALRIEASRMRGVLNAQSEWSQERGAIEQEVSRDFSDAFYRYYDKAVAAMFAGTSYAHTPLGTRPSFDRTTAAMLANFNKTWYAPNNAVLVIAGDVDPAATLAQVRSIFGSIPRRAVPAHQPVELAALKGRTITDESDFPVPLALLGYRMPGYNSPDYAAAEIALDVLGSQRADLYALQAEGKVLGTGVDYEPYPDAGLAYVYVATPPGGDTPAALSLVSDAIANYQKNGVPLDLVEAAKRREVAQALYSRNSITGLAMDWSQAVAVQGLASPDDVVAQLQKVTPDDVSRVLNKYLVRDQAIVGILTPKPGAVPSGGGSLSIHDVFSPTNVKPVKLPAWASPLAAVPPVPKSNVAPSDERLPNGIRLIVQPETVSPTVTVRGEVRNNADLQTAPGQEGVADVLGGLFSYGTATYDRLAFQKELDDVAADVTAGTTFSLQVPVQGFDRGVELLADNELHPALPATAFSIVQQQTAQTLVGELKSPDFLASRAMQDALVPKGDPDLREATPQTVSGLTLPDVKAYEAGVIRPDMTTIVVAGDVTRDQARAAVEKWFGDWSTSGPPPQTVLQPVPPNRAAYRRVTAPGRTQTSVSLREEIGLRRSDPDFYAVQLGNTILGGAFYATRFSRDLRQKNGLVYDVGASLTASKYRTNYGVSFGSDPQNVSRARTIIVRDLRDMSRTAPSTTELRQAKTQLLRDLDLSESSVDSIAGGLAARANAGLPLDEPTQRAHAILGLGGERVRAAFAKWIDPSRFVEVDVGPASPST